MYRYVDQQAVNQTLNPFGAMQGMPGSNMFGAPAMVIIPFKRNSSSILNYIISILLNCDVRSNFMVLKVKVIIISLGSNESATAI
jgi:hypothetical protein